jgi:molybdate transport system substrate-binding protein
LENRLESTAKATADITDTLGHPGGTAMRTTLLILAGAIGAAMSSAPAQALELKVLTAGAFRSSVLALGPEYEKASGNKLIIDNDTVGGLVKKVEAGETFDVIFLTPKAIDELAAMGKIAPFSRTNLAKVGVGVMVKEGAPKPDVSTVEAFKKALLDAKSVSYIDPASGGSSGIYVGKLLQRLGIADQVKPKEKLKHGGYVADLISSGQSELGIHQISEIVPAKGVTFVGPLPNEIQNYTVYAAGIGPNTKYPDEAKKLIATFTSPSAQALFKSRGMEPGGP